MLDYKNDEMNIPTFLDGATVEYKWAFVPHRCDLTGKIIWFKSAYRASNIYRNDMEFYSAHRWFTKEAYIKYLLEL